MGEVRKRYLAIVDVCKDGNTVTTLLVAPSEIEELCESVGHKLQCDQWQIGGDEDSYDWVTRLRDDDHAVLVDDSGREVTP